MSDGRGSHTAVQNRVTVMIPCYHAPCDHTSCFFLAAVSVRTQSRERLVPGLPMRLSLLRRIDSIMFCFCFLQTWQQGHATLLRITVHRHTYNQAAQGETIDCRLEAVDNRLYGIVPLSPKTKHTRTESILHFCSALCNPSPSSWWLSDADGSQPL